MSPEKRRSICTLLFPSVACLHEQARDFTYSHPSFEKCLSLVHSAHEVWESLSRRGTRSGLGLYVCSRLVSTVLNGHLRIDSELNIGTTVTFTAKLKIVSAVCNCLSPKLLEITMQCNIIALTLSQGK